MARLKISPDPSSYVGIITVNVKPRRELLALPSFW